MSAFDPLVTTTWPPSGTSSMQRATTSSGPSSNSMRKPAEHNVSTASGNNCSKRGPQHPTNSMSTTVDPDYLDTRFDPWPEMSPNKRRKHSATAQTTDESYQTMLEMGSPSPDQEWWLRENTIVTPDDEPDCEDGQGKDAPGDNSVGRACSSPAPHAPQPTRSDHRARNRTAATKCRAKAKAAATELETAERESEIRHQRLSAQATSLQNEVLALKNEVLMHGNCDSEVIQQYLTNAAKRVIGGGRT